MRTSRFTETGLGGYHPVVSFSYFICVIGCSLLFVHPVYAYLSLGCAALHAGQLAGGKRLWAALLIVVPTWLMMAAGNPVFNHHGSTYLFYWNFNPITLEACVYGLVAAGMMAACILWFYCYSEVVTSDKFLYIFGRLLPTLALIASMTLRLIPKLIAQTRVIADSQRTLGLDCAEGPLARRAKSGMRVLSVLVTWALEDAVNTADSMRARGYGTGRRSHFSVFILCRRDVVILGALGFLFGLSLLSYALGFGTMHYYPVTIGPRADLAALLFYGAFLLLGLLPILITAREDARWNCLESKI